MLEEHNCLKRALTAEFQLSSLIQSRDIERQNINIDLDRIMPNVVLVRAIFKYYKNVQVATILNHYFLVIMYTHTHIHTHRETMTNETKRL